MCKKDLASAAVDGQIPDESQALSPAKASEYWRNWLDRLESGDVQTVARREIKVPLDGTPAEKAKRIATYGDFGELNRRWNNSLGSTTHTRLKANPTEWAQYHTLYREHRASWPVVPVEEVAKWLVQRRGWIVADLGCGEDLLRKEVGEAHKILSFDHVAINEHVVECDLADVPLKDDEVDVSVFCLSLMGSNFPRYLDEAYRITKPLGFLHIIESSSRFTDSDEFAERLKEYGFEILEVNSRWKFTHIIALKKAGKVSESRNISF